MRKAETIEQIEARAEKFVTALLKRNVHIDYSHFSRLKKLMVDKTIRESIEKLN